MNNEVRIMNQEVRSKIKNFTDLETWKEGHKLVIMIYETTKQFPKEEIFGLTSQIRRCVVSMTSNIAEGFSRQSYKEKVQFYSMAQGSLTELQNQMLIARDVNYMGDKIFKEFSDQSLIVHKLLNGLIKKSKFLIHNS